MTQAKAATVAAAIVNAGHFARVAKLDNDWIVYANPGTGGYIDVDTIKTFQDAQQITGNVESVVFN